MWFTTRHFLLHFIEIRRLNHTKSAIATKRLGHTQMPIGAFYQMTIRPTFVEDWKTCLPPAYHDTLNKGLS